MMGFFKQASLWRGLAFRQSAHACRGYLFLRVSEYLLDHNWVFNTGDDVHGRTNAAGAGMRRSGDLDRTAAFTAGFNINIAYMDIGKG